MSYKRFKQEANLIFKYSTSGRLLVICKQEGQLVRNLRIYKEFHNATRALELDEGYKTTVHCVLCLVQPSIQVSLRYKSNDQQLSVDFSLSPDQCTCDELQVVAFWIIAHKHQLNPSMPFLCITSLLSNMGKATTKVNTSRKT